jgi:hypothetical protein
MIFYDITRKPVLELKTNKSYIEKQSDSGKQDTSEYFVFVLSELWVELPSISSYLWGLTESNIAIITAQKNFILELVTGTIRNDRFVSSGT